MIYYFSTQLILGKEYRYIMKIFSSRNYIYEPLGKKPDQLAEKEILHLVNFRLYERYNSNRPPTHYQPVTFIIDPKKPYYKKLRLNLERKLNRAGYVVRIQPEGTFKIWCRREPR